MPSIIPSLTPPTIAPNVTATIEISGDVTIAGGETRYSSGLDQGMYFAYALNNSWTLTFTNAGTMWADGVGSAPLLTVPSFNSITNSGTMVSRASSGIAQTIQINANLSAFHNSGSIYAIGTNNALAVTDWSGSNQFFNGGTIAAQGTLNSTAISRVNGGTIVNSADGRILSESADAIAIYMGRGHFVVGGTVPDTTIDVNNAGLIEARSTGSEPSIGILLSTAGYEHNRVVNTGTIRADIAIYGDGTGFSPAAHSTETVINEAGALIDGAIFLGLGDDRVVNRGTINGFVAMAEDADLVDTREGVINGGIDMGWGMDMFLGGATGEAVTGNRGDDTLRGGGGNDLLLGGFGSDTLEGGAGNDALYGEGGDDIILTSGGDRVVAGSGDDRIELGDYRFAHVAGEAGYDVLVLPSDGRVLDLQAVAAAQRISGIEEIRLVTGGEIVARAADIAALTGGNTLVISGDGAGTVDLAGAWTQGAAVTQRGVTYAAYTSGNATVLVAAGLTVASGAAPTGAGLDAVAAGGAAPAPGTIPGIDFAPTLTVVNGWSLIGELTIDATETWRSTDGAVVIRSEDPYAILTNYGRISSSGTAVANGVSVYNMHTLANYGTIEVHANSGTERLAENRARFETYGVMNTVGNLEGNVNATYAGSSFSQFLNEGQLIATSVQAFAVGHQNWLMRDAVNTGSITATSSHFIAVGFYAHNGGTLINSGTISATGGWGAYGFGASTHQLNLVNSGTIRAVSTDPERDSIGIDLYYQGGWQTIDNSGLIAADIAIQTSWNINGGSLWLDNSGRIEGHIQLNVHPNSLTPREDVILNSGTIAGDVSMGGFRDIFYGVGGTQSGTIFGGDGGDWLAGGSGRDRLNGGAGDDVLLGGGGDTLTGGGGRDIFAFDRVIAGSAAETITDFVSGSDRIDVSALHPTNVAIAGTRVTVTTANGTLTINTNAPVSMSDIVTTRIATLTGTDGNDTLFGSSEGSILLGGAGFDLLIGGAGNDRLEGGAAGYGDIGEVGNIMWGGAGDDVYVMGNRWDLIIELDGGGYDTLIAGTTGTLTLPDHVEAFIGSRGVGNALDNVMTGTADGDELDGREGADRLVGLAGSDVYTVDSQADLIFENPGEGNDLVHSSVSFQLYANVENLELEQRGTALNGIGNDLDNRITGNEQDNVLIGYGGNDTLIGWSGNDLLFGMDGDDTLWGSDGIDYLVGGTGNDTLEGHGESDALYGEDGDDVLDAGAGFHTDILVGGAGNDTLRGDSGMGDYDLMDGGAGNDSYYVDTPDDLTFEALNGGVDTVYATIEGAGYYLYANVENLVLGGNTPFGVGNALDNRITGSAASNWLLGGAGDDVLNGRGGNDVLFGEAGADIFVFESGSGGDVIGDFAPGTDRIDLSAFGFTSFAQVRSQMGENGGTSFIALGGADFVVLNGVAMSALDADDFILAAPAAAEPARADALFNLAPQRWSLPQQIDQATLFDGTRLNAGLAALEPGF